MNPLVSIIIPAYNAEKWISYAIRSALGQTWESREIIIVDDGSKDRTLEIAKTFESSAVKVMAQPNAGASAARNRGLDAAQGDYIQWLDADDILAPGKIKSQLVNADGEGKDNVLFTSGWGMFFHWPGRSQLARSRLWRNLDPVEWLYTKLEENAWMCIESWLVSRSLTEEAGPWNEELSMDDDGEYFGRLVTRAAGIVFIPYTGSFCRAGNAGSLSSTVNISDGKLLSQYRSLELNIRYLLGMEDSPRTRQAGVKFLQRWAPLFYPASPELFGEMKALAGELGGSLCEPVKSGKNKLLSSMFGDSAAGAFLGMLAEIKDWPAKTLEKLLLGLAGNDPLKALEE